MVHENMLKTAGIYTQSLMMRKKECGYFFFDFIPRYLKSCAAVQNYICEELGLPTSCIIIGSQLPRGGWEAWIDKKMNLARVVQLPRGGRCTRRPERLQSGDISENPTPQRTKDTRWKIRKTSEQVLFNESEWAMITLDHFLEHPDLRSRIKNLLMDTLLDTLWTTSGSLGASPRFPEISTSDCKFKEKTVSMSET